MYKINDEQLKVISSVRRIFFLLCALLYVQFSVEKFGFS